MKFTNKMNLPDAFINLINSDEKNHEINDFKYSVTELLGSAKEIVLKRRFANEITQDISDYIPALFGTAVHELLEKNASDEYLKEERLEMKFGKYTLVGRADLIDAKNGILLDYKTCSCSKVSKNDFEEWRLQGLMYAYMLFFTRDIKINKLRFIAMLKDWSKVKSTTSANYPASPVYVYEYDLNDSDYDFIGKWINDKLLEIYVADKFLPDCSDEDRWYTGTKYAVYVNSNDKRAKYVADTNEDAENYNAEKLNNEGIIIARKGNYLKCDLYCSLKEFCNQWK